ncbi:thioredoxin family protein [Mucilaginibacter limnophilus]|uniref:Thioredoxin family protein n=1 Tax=Mucilaginibacter limnophilus TaxID=1932778 RepID=A0A437MR77_9SPHI|nr:thioredoxin family protein [Mucilaginibacter limnophilus]RVU00132.1 thioredoxin family protein [Mucilaginibacter limnophilus]
MKLIKLIKQALGAMLLMLVAHSSFAEGITFQENKTWKELLTMAKKEHKILFLDAYTTWCGPCKYLQRNVFTHGDVATYYNANFINAAIDMEKGEGPTIAENFGVTAYPTLFFIDGDGKLLHKSVGALEAPELIALGKEAVDPAKQYYTVKAKAAAGQLSASALAAWAAKAEQMEDKDVEKIITDYVNNPAHNWLSKDVLTLVFDYGGAIPDEKMAYLLKNKAQVKTLMQWTDEDFDAEFKRKATLLAFDKASKGETLDFDIYKSTLTKYIPKEAELETRKVKVKYAFINKKNENGVKEFISLVNDGTALNLKIYDVASIVIDNAEGIAPEEQSTALIDKIKAYKLIADDAGKEYYRNFALMVLYYYKEDKDTAKQYAEKIKADPDAPENLTNVADKVING